MKVKHILILFLISYILVGIGGIFKIMHWPLASILIVVSGSVKLIAVALAIWKIGTTDRFNEFLNA